MTSKKLTKANKPTKPQDTCLLGLSIAADADEHGARFYLMQRIADDGSRVPYDHADPMLEVNNHLRTTKIHPMVLPEAHWEARQRFPLAMAAREMLIVVTVARSLRVHPDLVRHHRETRRSLERITVDELLDLELGADPRAFGWAQACDGFPPAVIAVMLHRFCEGAQAGGGMHVRGVTTLRVPEDARMDEPPDQE